MSRQYLTPFSRPALSSPWQHFISKLREMAGKGGKSQRKPGRKWLDGWLDGGLADMAAPPFSQ